MEDSKITSVLNESRTFKPPLSYRNSSMVQSEKEYEALWNLARNDSEAFWAKNAEELLHWFRPWDKTFVQDQDFHFKWFDGGQINASYNCLDRHLETRGEKIALIWEGEPGDKRSLTYRDLHQLVCRIASGFKASGLGKGDVVTIYMPMVPELTATVLACSRLGIMHNVVFAGFSSDALATRILDSGSKLVVTADGVWRKGASLELKSAVDDALEQCPDVQKVVVLKRTAQKVLWNEKRDQWWDEFIEGNSEVAAESLDSETPLFLLYTSGSTGKPKGVLHTTGGYLLGATLTSKYVFDLQDDDIFWCTADVGWITGHTYCIYGPLSLGATVLMYEGAPQYPDWGRFWKLIQDYKVTKFYTAPTAIRSFMKSGPEEPGKYDLSSLKLLGTVGEPINPEAWMWYHKVIGHEKCPIVDTWWQTETGSIMISALPGAISTKPGSAARPFPGIIPQIVDKNGVSSGSDSGGFLVIEKPWPSMMRTIFGDHERFKEAYWRRTPGKYFTGDGARCDEEGYYWIMGRIDDVLNVSGHRLSTMEIESGLVSHPDVTEAAVVGKEDEIKGEAIACFVILRDGVHKSDDLKAQLKAHVAKQIGPLARPDSIYFTEALPKTRSGKIMRRLLRDLAMGREITGDVSTLENFQALKEITVSEQQT